MIAAVHRRIASNTLSGTAHAVVSSSSAPAAARRRGPLLAGALATLLAAVAIPASVASAAERADSSKAPRRFDRVVLIVLENKEFGQVIGRPDAPTFEGLARRYAVLTNYRAVAHPSLPNYLALVSGSTHAITSDCLSCRVSAPNLADTLERGGRTWKTYAEGLPRPGFTGAEAGRYAKKHNPFLYFTDVVSRPDRLRRIVPLGAFARDLRSGRLPDFALVVPDLCHDMHDCPVATGDAWLGDFLAPLLRSNALRHGVVFVVFDEGTSTEGGGGHVPALVLGPLVRRASRTSAPLDHYALVRTIERAWGLPLLGRSRGAPEIRGIWR
jgi:phospholipase C